MIEYDILFEDVGRFVIGKDKASIGMIQRYFKIGFNRAARILDQLCEAGVVGKEDGIQPRKIIMNPDEFEDLVRNRPTYMESISLDKYSLVKPLCNEVLTNTTSYPNDGETLKNFKNMLVHKINEKKQYEIIDFLICHNSPQKMRMVMFDSSVLTYNRFANTIQLLLPIINDIGKLSAVINWLIAEKDDRIQKLINNNVTDFNQYNKNCNANDKLPCIILIINELYTIQKTSELEENFINLLLHGEKLGIYCILFTQFDSRNLSLGPKTDLITIYNFAQVKEMIGMQQTTITNPKINEIADVDEMDGIAFEKFCMNLLKINGFTNIELTPGSGDHGIDLLAQKEDISYAIQCKCYSSNIGNAAVQQAHTGKSIYHKDISVVMTNRYFTQQAIDEADSLGVKLWDRDRLQYMISRMNE